MAELKWVKIVTDMFENLKIIAIESRKNSDRNLVIWIKILCLAGKINNSGLLTLNGSKPFDETMIASAIRRDTEKVKEAITIFKEYGMLENINGIYAVCNWDKYQSADKIEKMNERQKEYMKGYRAKQKALCNPNGKTNCNNNGKTNVSDAEERRKNLDIEVIQREYKEKVANAPSRSPITKVFVKPTVEEVRAYCKERKNKVDPEQWVNHYEAKGWVVGKAPMKDWKAAVRTWEKNGINQSPNGNGKSEAVIDWMEDYVKSIEQGGN